VPARTAGYIASRKPLQSAAKHPISLKTLSLGHRSATPIGVPAAVAEEDVESYWCFSLRYGSTGGWVHASPRMLGGPTSQEAGAFCRFYGETTIRE
jgi:hypothetical protein